MVVRCPSFFAGSHARAAPKTFGRLMICTAHTTGKLKLPLFFILMKMFVLNRQIVSIPVVSDARPNANIFHDAYR